MSGFAYSIPPAAVALPTLALFTLIIDTPPFIWHIRNRNLAASSLVFCILLSNLLIFINALIWPTDDIFHWWQGSGLCDIEAKLEIALGFGTVGSLACIMRSLAIALDTKRTTLSPSKAQHQRKIAIDFLFCFGGPIYSMAVHYIVQPNRYNIFAISGCSWTFDYSWPSIVLIIMWPPIICLVAVYNSLMVMLRMHKYRKEFSEVLSSSNSNLTKSRFMRLFWLSIILILVVLPVQLYVLIANTTQFPYAKYSWDAIHSDWNVVSLFPTGGVVRFDRWLQIAVGFVVFFFFGLGQDAQTMYSKWLIKLGLGRIFPCLGRQPRTGQQPDLSGTSSTRALFKRRWSRGSFLSLHSHKSNPASISTISPSEPQNGFTHLSTITENEKRPSDAPSNTTDATIEKEVIPASVHGTNSWLTRLLIKVHLSAPGRQYMARPNVPGGPHGLGFFGTNVQTTCARTEEPKIEEV